jgi:hypothetical protein
MAESRRRAIQQGTHIFGREGFDAQRGMGRRHSQNGPQAPASTKFQMEKPREPYPRGLSASQSNIKITAAYKDPRVRVPPADVNDHHHLGFIGLG